MKGSYKSFECRDRKTGIVWHMVSLLRNIGLEHGDDFGLLGCFKFDGEANFPASAVIPFEKENTKTQQSRKKSSLILLFDTNFYLPIFSNSEKYQEAGKVLRHVFNAYSEKFRYNSLPIGFDDTIREIEKRCNYQVISVQKIVNVERGEKFSDFARKNDIKEIFSAYYGTSKENAKLIAHEGFSKFEALKEKQGIGIFLTTNIFRSIGTSTPSGENQEQVVLATTLLKGPSNPFKLGSASTFEEHTDQTTMTIEGMNKYDLRVKFSDQICAKYIITVRYCFETPATLSHTENVLYYHPLIYNRVMSETCEEKTRLTPSGPDAGNSGLNCEYSIKNIQVDDEVIVIKTERKFDEFLNRGGSVREIAMDEKSGKICYHVQITDKVIHNKPSSFVILKCFPSSLLLKNDIKKRAYDVAFGNSV